MDLGEAENAVQRTQRHICVATLDTEAIPGVRMHIVRPLLLIAPSDGLTWTTQS